MENLAWMKTKFDVNLKILVCMSKNREFLQDFKNRVGDKLKLPKRKSGGDRESWHVWDLEDSLLYEKQKIVKKSDVKRTVTKTFIKNKSGGCRKIWAKAADDYSELGKRNVLKVTENDLKFRRFKARFTNKAVHKPICARKVP